jgi:hypothetical protein
MKWMEVIELRTAEKDPEILRQVLIALKIEFGKTGSMKDLKMYRDAHLENDASIHMHWVSGKVEPQGSAIGFCISNILKEFGLVSHSVWIEAE